MILYPGQTIDFIGGQTTRVVEAPRSTVAKGIADPFLATHVQPGQWFYMVLFPNTVTGMLRPSLGSTRPVPDVDTDHPAVIFEADNDHNTAATRVSSRQASERWLRSYAYTHSPNASSSEDAFHEFMRNVREYSTIFYDGEDLHSLLRVG